MKPIINRTLALFIGVLLPLTSMDAKDGSEKLYGTWSLISFSQKFVATGETIEVFGESPSGFINYSRDGRMMVLIVKDERPKPSDLANMTDQERAELFKTMVAYGGTYTLEDETITHHLDISFNQIWTGTDQVRNIKFDGEKVILSTNPQPRLQDGRVVVANLTWEKVD